MPIDFVLVPATDTRPSGAAVSPSFFFDPARVRRLLAAAADSGFDAVVVDDASGPLSNVDIAASVAQWNDRLGIVLTHWADVTSPLVAASDFASLDRASGGRLSLRILAGEPADDGFLATWKRTDEYLTLLKRLWSNDRPIDHEGPFFSLSHALVPDKGLRGHEIPIRMSGNTGTEIDVAARHATVFEVSALDSESLVGQIDRVVTAAARYGRSGRVSFSARVQLQSGRIRDLPALLSAGVTEFMVSGLDDEAAIARFGVDVIAPLRRRAAEPAAPPLRLVAASLAMGLL